MFAPLLFTIPARQYKHFSFDEADARLTLIVILGICGGCVLAALLSLYQSYLPGGFVRALLRCGAHTEETAKTAAELGFEKSFFIRLELRRGTMLKKLVTVTEGKSEGAPPRYYIPEALKYRAEVRYEKKGNGPVQLLLTVLLLFFLAWLCTKLIPVVLSLIDAML